MKNLKYVVVALVVLLVGVATLVQTASASNSPVDAAPLALASEGAGGSCTGGGTPVPTTWDFATGLAPFTATYLDHSQIGVVTYTWVHTTTDAPEGTGGSTSGPPYARSIDFPGDENGTGNLYDEYLTSPAFEVPTGTDTVMTYQNQQMFEIADTQCWDAGFVQVTNDGGTTWDYVSIVTSPDPFTETPPYDMDIHDEYVDQYPYEDAMAYCPLTPSTTDPTMGFRDWHAASVDLTAYAGQTIQVRFVQFVDNLAGGFGWVVDDISATICPEGPTAVTVSTFDSNTTVPVLPIVGMALAGLVAVGVIAKRVRR
jgi:hypothetical protein